MNWAGLSSLFIYLFIYNHNTLYNTYNTNSVPIYFLPCIVLDIFLGLQRITFVLILDLSITFKATISNKSYSPAIELSFKSIFSSLLNSIFANNCAFLFFLGSES